MICRHIKTVASTSSVKFEKDYRKAIERITEDGFVPVFVKFTTTYGTGGYLHCAYIAYRRATEAEQTERGEKDEDETLRISGL